MLHSFNCVLLITHVFVSYLMFVYIPVEQFVVLSHFVLLIINPFSADADKALHFAIQV